MSDTKLLKRMWAVMGKTEGAGLFRFFLKYFLFGQPVPLRLSHWYYSVKMTISEHKMGTALYKTHAASAGDAQSEKKCIDWECKSIQVQLNNSPYSCHFFLKLAATIWNVNAPAWNNMSDGSFLSASSLAQTAAVIRAIYFVRTEFAQV